MLTEDPSAGSDTVSCALQSAVYHMIRHPSAWQRARAEIDEAQARGGLCGDRVVSYADAQQLPYLQACFKEALRVFHPVSMGTPRVVPRDGVTIGGRFFPAGTTVSLNTFCMNLSAEVWGPDAREFKPERWMVEDTSALEKNFLPVSNFHFVLLSSEISRRPLGDTDIVSIVLRWHRSMRGTASGPHRDLQDPRYHHSGLRYCSGSPRARVEVSCVFHSGSWRLARVYHKESYFIIVLIEPREHNTLFIGQCASLVFSQRFYLSSCVWCI